MKILITGGCGFIGVNVVKQLNKKHELICYDNLSMGKKEDILEFSTDFIKGDIKNFDLLLDSSKGCDAIIHLAAFTNVIDSINNPRMSVIENVIGTVNVFEAARKNGVQKVIFASTGGAILGDVEPPVHEEILPKPISPYGASKLCCEAYAYAYAGSYNLDSIGLRFANVYGPYSYHKGSAVAKFFKNILNEKPLIIFGDGKQTRDFVFVEDLAAIIEKTIVSDIKGFEQFHLGSGKEVSILELVKLIKKVTGKEELQIKFKDARKGEIIRNYTMIDKAKELLGYEPSFELKDGLMKTWDWFLENKSII